MSEDRTRDEDCCPGRHWTVRSIIDVRIRSGGIGRQFKVKWVPTLERVRLSDNTKGICKGGVHQRRCPMTGAIMWRVKWLPTWEPADDLPRDAICEFYEKNRV